jgi:putative heme-binding domain-containing protein
MLNRHRLILFTALLLPLQTLHADDVKTVAFKETFGSTFDARRFTTRLPNKNTEVRDGVLWTHGSSGRKYPPMVYLPVKGQDITISFRYRHLGPGGMVWFFVDGDDGFGSVDHMLRVKLMRNGIKLQVDSHSLDANHPLRQKKNRPADKVSKAYRLNEMFPVEKVDLSASKWHQVSLAFKGKAVSISLDGRLWKKSLTRPCFDAAKRKLLWMQNGGEKGIEIDDIVIAETVRSAPKKKKQARKRPARKKRRQSVVGPAIGGNKATPINRITVAKGFKVELLYSVPGVDQGSWVNLCTDNKGRLLVSDQFGGLYRITPPPAGQVVKRADVEKVPAKIRAVNGMVWAFGALYVGVNDYERKIPSGLYRISDSNGDDKLDKVELLREIQSKSDHGVHAVLPTPDGKALYLVTGNNADPPKLAKSSPVRQVWGEDHLLPSMPDGRGHNRGRLGPGGIIYRVSPDGKKFEAFASGFRNIFDAAVNREGELFTYDADMEYDFNTPWYRPTRICQVTSGAEFGWRNGAGKRVPFYADNMPGILDIGPGSPTGMTFGYGAKFPAKYQNALFALDWSWGRLYAVHLKENGASYTATKEEFVTGAPLPITDAIIHPGDGAMYFTIGGRRVQSGLYRVTYVGDKSTAPVPSKSRTPNRQTVTRRMLETFHGKQNPAAITTAWPHLAAEDRFVRFAARTAVEHQPTETWANKALKESDPAKQVVALLALARVTGVCPQHRKADTPQVDTKMRDKLLSALTSLDSSKLNQMQQLTLHRTVQIVLTRFGQPDDAMVKKMISTFDPQFPAKTYELNWLLCENLAFLQSPTVARKAIALIEAAPAQEEQMQYARSIRMLKAGWTPKLRTAYFKWFLKAANYKGGASFDKFIEFIRNDAVASLTNDEKSSMAKLLALKPVKKTALENFGKIFEGRKEKKWTLNELSAAARTGLKNRDFKNGRKMFAASGCFACHRFGNQGGMTGPDLTSAGRRYSSHDLLDQVINPSKVINEQFSAITVVTNAGKVHTGVVVNLNGDQMILNTDLTNPNKRVSIDRKEIDELVVSKKSPMPEGLMNRMTKDEILDLVAYVTSAGDPKHRFFKK